MQSLICDRLWVPFWTIDRQIIHSIKFAIERKRVQQTIQCFELPQMGKTQEVLRDYEKNTPLNLEAAQVTLSSNQQSDSRAFQSF